MLEQYINGAAQYLPNEGNLWTDSPTPFQGASDENFTSWNDDRHAAIKFLLDEITPYSVDIIIVLIIITIRGIIKESVWR